MKAKLLLERGQALILIGLAAFGLFAVAGLAIDGSAKYSDRRHAQNAADTSALAGAYAKLTGDPQWVLAALDRADSNGYSGIGVVHVYNPPNTGLYADCSDVHFDCHNYVQVTIDSTIDTWFARIIGINQTHNHVEAVASTISQNNSFTFGGNSVVALSPTGCALMTQGNATVTIRGGGLYTNSDDPTCSYKKDSCAGLVDVDSDLSGTQGTVTMVGGYSVNTGCMPQASLSPAGATQISFPPPYQEIAEPAVCSTSTINGPNGSTVTLSPGHYTKMPPRPSMSNITLQPGVYCIDTTLKLNAGDTLTVQGTYTNPPTSPGVFLYFRPGGSFTFNGGSSVILWGINDSSSPYNHFLMYLAPDYASGTPVNCTINGNTYDRFWGGIYAPFCNVTLDGTSDPTGFYTQVIGYTVKFAGGSNVTLYYSADSTPVWTIPLQVGLAR
jgi:hypothetical protein